MKLSYIEPVVKTMESIDKRLAKFHFEAFKRSLFKILGYLTSFAIGIKVSAINIGQLLGNGSVIKSVLEVADAGMYFTVTIFSMILLMNHMIRMCSGDCKDKSFVKCIMDYAKLIGGTMLMYILYLSCHTWMPFVFEGIKFIIGL